MHTKSFFNKQKKATNNTTQEWGRFRPRSSDIIYRPSFEIQMLLITQQRSCFSQLLFEMRKNENGIANRFDLEANAFGLIGSEVGRRGGE